ncbi:hypothetical protein BDV93DRAFT_529815 [Ceratobasidium sp. AG-I]|nr:hypothetical protein BDV93DRAFT_529938 [Ceratobasidium sp. AG-I]KAF8593572.1 hypothetical protein BDV93DRAFT_529815 [Ceratobasidium sp. AG-I]
MQFEIPLRKRKRLLLDKSRRNALTKVSQAPTANVVGRRMDKPASNVPGRSERGQLSFECMNDYSPRCYYSSRSIKPGG